jgi:CYTH domain-containing protein
VEPRPRYSILEIERRWLVNPKDIGNLAQSPFKIIKDLYITGTRLRLRLIEDVAGKTIYKLGKKYGKESKIAEPITTLYLTKNEYDLFSKMPGKLARKKRYILEKGSLDQYMEPNLEHMIFELEFNDEASALSYVPPKFVSEEITGIEEYSGYKLSQ